MGGRAEPTYEGLKHQLGFTASPPSSGAEPTYEGLKLHGCDDRMGVAPGAEPTYEGLKPSCPNLDRV